jgi:hypothetical protein
MKIEMKQLKEMTDKGLSYLKKWAVKEIKEYEKFIDKIIDEEAKRFNKKI